ncbi:uncharacterized protein NEMAJ01_1453 [Nematocida major]|uniref:uncharacterized protein n=1 Tax=Nematocida major TaxID=1912982 RepID=UPI0020075A6C|nr:uncharacterized protein NEMAJ01_1453 [Nematocida major]KAH9386557.1 hypothetical protein NEMAJ01_1453 [Nematocida major]
MKYHSLTIRPNNIYVQESIEHDTIIKSVSLTPVVSETSLRSSLLASIDGNEVTLCNLLTNKIETKILNIPLSKGVRVELRTEGDNEIDVLFLEIESHDVEHKPSKVSYKAVRVTEKEKYTIDRSEAVKILNISISNEDESPSMKPTQIIIKDGDVVLKITELVPGKKECEVVDIEIENQNVEIEVKGPGAIDMLFLQENTEEPACCHGEEKCLEEASAESAEEKHPASEEEKKEQKDTEDACREALQGAAKRKHADDAEGARKKALLETEGKVQEIEQKSTEQPEEAVEASVRMLSDGIGKLIGKKSFISVSYSVSEGSGSKSFEETILVRKLLEHTHLKHFSSVIRGSREGASFKAELKAPSGTTEVLLNIGKVAAQQ